MNNIRCIVISGKSNSGKTTSILSLINVFRKYKLIKEGTFSDHNKTTKDRWAIFEINGKKVGLFSQGDSRYGIEHGLRETKNCDFIIGASHLYGDTISTYFDYKVKCFKQNEVLFINKIHFDENIYIDENEKFIQNIKELIFLML